jgi:hypothetical protein
MAGYSLNRRSKPDPQRSGWPVSSARHAEASPWDRFQILDGHAPVAARPSLRRRGRAPVKARAAASSLLVPKSFCSRASMSVENADAFGFAMLRCSFDSRRPWRQSQCAAEGWDAARRARRPSTPGSKLGHFRARAAYAGPGFEPRTAPVTFSRLESRRMASSCRLSSFSCKCPISSSALRLT